MLSTALMIFRRDLRLDDNTALLAAARSHDAVLPLFILDDTLMKRWQRATRRLDFLVSCLDDLDAQLGRAGGQLACVAGKPADVVGELLSTGLIDEVFFNRDYSPVARRRDAALQEVAAGQGVPLTICDDAMLNPPDWVRKGDGTPYTVFTPYWKRAIQEAVAAPLVASGIQYTTGGLPGLADHDLAHLRLDGSAVIPAGRAGAISMMAPLRHLKYGEYRDVPAANQTSRLAAHLRLGTVSAREVYAAVRDAMGEDSPLERQLYWRDFYLQISANFPHVYGKAFRPQYDAVEWDDNAVVFERWKAGETGFPIIDAGMRELAATGLMHNRVRMIVASFLTKNLHIDWRLGEAWFAEQLIDYEPAANNGNWQWSASTGCDAQPYFRIFNPWRQQQRFDPDCAYIRQWVPELAQLPPKVIHGLEKDPSPYLPQIVNLKLSAEESKRRFKAAA